jgi:cation:H+ antiporter
MKEQRREFILALLVPLVVLGILADGVYSRWEATVSLAVFAFWLTLVARHAWRERSAPETQHVPRSGWIPLALSLAGAGLLALAGKFIVMGGTGLGQLFGLDPFFIGVTIVALGTSTPELATAVISKLRGHDEVGVGTILGSNIFNCLFIVGLTGVVAPFEVQPQDVAVSIGFGVATVLCLIPLRGQDLGRHRGLLLLALYAASIFAASLTQVK